MRERTPYPDAGQYPVSDSDSARNASLPEYSAPIRTDGPVFERFKRSRFCVNENTTLIRLLEFGLGFGVLPKEIAEPLIEGNKLVSLNQGRSYKIPFALAWYPRKEMPDYFREVVQMIK